MRRNRLSALATGLGACLALTACGANETSNEPAQQPAGSGSNGGAKVGVILPETATSARWESFDKPILEKAMRDAGLDPDVQNAQGDVQKFSSLADTMISRGVKVLVIAAINGEVGAQVAAKAKARGIPVIDYDRLNVGGSSDYYVSFDNVKVGELQGKGMAEALKAKPAAQVVEIEGGPTDNNATLFHRGQRNVLQPLYDNGTLKLVRSQPIDGWDNQKGGTTFEQILTGNGGKVDGVVAANDGLAGAVITVLRKNRLNGRVPVVGQDATQDGLMAVLRGDQYMTVFKPIKQEAEATAKLAAALSRNDKDAAKALAVGGVNDPKANRMVPSVLLEPRPITKAEVKVVVDEGYVKPADICGGELAGVCATLGI
ncbi:monosaccharide ABC transporter substrate-binding protein (CUT2 family) [Herbihabitans rhizosphaerae]|uniref:Monosaccharide ABC transporter substrate-binding protein (CUT2 family) n=1 Tax=Herbihabitans rhizosphaerae TaxID=1872711 RepID=A0A4Q7KUP2_9PSEU|nr:substrate-binding domain-containing protein [Herbihabitans rhizosphaerae]RZS39212.1 monosaccharide ABC transporter substrate-binding protein (CUT2 family) [Herbihabitans rhizosphaerae]